MATKCTLLVVAALSLSALAANDSPASLVAAKEVAEAFGEALKEEQPLLKDAELHKSAVMASKDDLVAALANPGGWASQFEKDVTDLVIGLSKGGFGATPFGDSVKKISDIIQKEMMPTVIEFHEKDQGTLNELSAAVHQCGAVKKKELDAANKLKLKYTTTSKDHKKCRGEEAALYSENVECHAEWLARKKEKELKCKAYSVVTKRYGDSNANKNIVNKAGSEDVETYVRRITTTVCGNRIICPTCKNGGGGGPSGIGGGMLDDLLKHKKLCEVATHRYNVQTTKCNLLDKKWHDKRKSCNSLQDTMDASSCKWAIDTKDACESYAECYKATVQAYEDAKCSEWSGKKFPKTINCTKGVEADEKQRHPEFKGLKRMDCIIQAFGGSGGITMKDILACKAKTHYTNNSKLGVDLVIKYPGYPDLVPCVVPLLYPNTAEYKAAEFTPLPTLAKGKFGANECTGVREVSTTPATGSPASCKCERVTMNGPYSPGAVVKCVNCLDVSKSTEKTSCPSGTKLFSPQSRQDWDSFLKSAKPLRAPNWIIDVTRPQNGCGGCTGHTMNSQTTQQQSWVTKDNSPWWLRSTRYNEPNGDYHANCYLDLWQTPANSNSVTWNDGSCSYHSKSYYCQVVKFSLIPKPGSPKGCTCKKVELNGKYSARFLLKCDNCLDVRRSKDKNSCPSGTKLFSPTSREDWKTFIKSATQLRAPHWIIDITRPSNGCGGCTKNAMHSGNAAQGTWHTADGSPWWLRSTTYNEPNGDYHANCYLDLWHNPPNENSVTWNDGNCNYHSKSYYCQTVGGKKNKVTTTLPAWKKKEQWKLVMKVDGDATFGYSSAYWTNDALLNDNADAKSWEKRWAFVMDSKKNLIAIKKGPITGSGKTEVHRLTAASNYKSFDLQTATALHYTDDTWDFVMDSKDNLVAILKGPTTGSKKTEVHRMSAASGYKKFDLQVGTGLHYTDKTWAFVMDSKDNLVCIKKGPVTGSKKTEVHRLSAASNYAKFDLQTGTGLHYTDDTWAFAMDSKNNLVCIKKGPLTGTKKTEVHRLSAASNYAKFDLQTGTALHYTDATWAFVMSGDDLVGVKRGPVTGSKMTEVHRLSSAGNYGKFNLQVGTGLHLTWDDFNAKYPAFTKVPFSKIKMCVGKPYTNCVEHKFTRDYANAKALFAAGYIRDKTVDQKGILKAFGPAKDSYQSCPMQRPGFNIQCNDGNKARWGYCTNCQSQPCQNADSNDADASIGIGLAGQSTPRQMGAGWTNYFASGKGTCSPNSMTSKQVWFYVYENLML